MQILLSTLMILIWGCFILAAAPVNATRQWRIMTGFYSITLILALAYAVLKITYGNEAILWFNPSIVSALILPLVSFLAVILTRYAKTYLNGQSEVSYFQRWFSLTLLSVCGVLTSNHMLLFLWSWISISLCFHNLLMIFPERPRAALAAHKKFIFARIAESCLLVAFVLFYQYWQSPWISEWVSNATNIQTLPISLSIASVLLVITAMIKCAQLPIHGWLIQVVESPTPVSALLHAGIVNLGGFLIILFAPLINLSPLSLWLMLIWSSLSLFVAALVMHTRISIKVRLAWSTCAQMGFMLLECALGYYELALLHLLAHSLYKAYAFLNASSTVNVYLQRQLSDHPRINLYKFIASMLISVVFVWLWNEIHAIHHAMTILYVAMFTVLFNHLFGRWQWWLTIPIAALLLVSVYELQRLGLYRIMMFPENTLSTLMLSWVSGLFVLLSGLYWLLKLAPNHPQSRAFYRLLYAGFYLDEWSTRLTLAIWPTELPKNNLLIVKRYSQEIQK